MSQHDEGEYSVQIDGSRPEHWAETGILQVRPLTSKEDNDKFRDLARQFPGFLRSHFRAEGWRDGPPFDGFVQYQTRDLAECARQFFQNRTDFGGRHGIVLRVLARRPSHPLAAWAPPHSEPVNTDISLDADRHRSSRAGSPSQSQDSDRTRHASRSASGPREQRQTLPDDWTSRLDESPHRSRNSSPYGVNPSGGGRESLR